MKTKPLVSNLSNEKLAIMSAEELSSSIASIARTTKALFGGRLSREAIVVLIQAKSGVPKRTIELVLNNLEQLEDIWLRKKKE